MTELAADKKSRLVWIMVLYLLGLFIGALNMGVITPVRPIIQSSLHVDSAIGIWMVNIYTLCYAAIIPIAGKVADRIGRKSVYFVSILLFGIGSVVCGLSESLGSFAVLMVGRVLQAAGAGGIMPIATAEFGTSFPPEKRGMALGMVGAVYGIGSVLGATVGSAVLDIFGTTNWQWLFYINVFLCIPILIGTVVMVPNHKGEVVGKIDKLGTLVMTLLILSLLYGLKNLDFFDFLPSLTSVDVYPFLLAFVLLLPLFILIEKKAEDPIFNLSYVHSPPIIITLVLSLFVGASMMGMVFIPQFAENALKIPAGSGGYFVLILGLFAGAASPISGGLIDRFGAKPVMGAGFIISILGSLYLAFVATTFVNWFNVVLSLIVLGTGLGLVMGTPLNYMMLDHTKEEESNSALATLSLIRSVGTAVAPAIMVGFIIQAAVGIDTKLMEELPPLPDTPVLAEARELSNIMDTLSEDNEEVAAMAQDMDFEAFLDMPSMDMSSMEGDGDLELPDTLLEEFQNADVTTITPCVVDMTAWMFREKLPGVVDDIQGGIAEGREGIGEGIDGIGSGISELRAGAAKMKTAMQKLQTGISGISAGIDGMEKGIAQQEKAIAGIQAAIAMAESGGGMVSPPVDMTPKALAPSEAEGGNEQDGGSQSEGGQSEGGQSEGGQSEGGQGEGGSGGAPSVEQLKTQLAQLTAAKEALEAKRDEAIASRKKMQSALSQMKEGFAGMNRGLGEMEEQRDLMVRADVLMAEIYEEIPVVFDEMEAEYIASIKEEHSAFEDCFQKAMNRGYRNMFLFVAIMNCLGLALLPFYKEAPKSKKTVAKGEVKAS